MPLLLATHSPGKLLELARLAPRLTAVRGLADLGITAVAPEEHATFEENARQKATFYRDLVGLPTLADDSGLCVDAIDGAPGVHSARYLEGTSQEEKNALLCATVAATGQEPTARFVCALALAMPNEVITVRGGIEGLIVTAPRGRAGFGYDPVFLLRELDRTFAELDDDEKDAWSHRARAIRALTLLLEARPEISALLLAPWP